MQSKRYYEYLLDSLPDDPGVVVARLVRGVAWTAAMLYRTGRITRMSCRDTCRY